MALHFYFDAGKTNKISDDGSMSNPDLTVGEATLNIMPLGKCKARVSYVPRYL